MGRRTVAVIVGSALGGGVAHAEPRFRVERVIDVWADQYTPQASGMQPGGASAGGKVVGTVSRPSNATEALIWDASGPAVLPAPAGARGASAIAINNGGVVVGYVWTGPLASDQRVVVWENGQPREMPPPPPGNQGWTARAINDRGHVLGEGAGDPNVPEHRLVLWRDGQATIVGPEAAIGRALNNQAQVVGCRVIPGSHLEPFVWAGGQTQALAQLAAGPAGSGCANDLNDSGLIVGRSGFKPVLWQSGAVQNLAPPGLFGDARRINIRGEVLGAYGDEDQFGFYRPGNGGGIWDLESLVDLPPGLHFPAQVIDMDDQGRLLALVLGDNDVRHLVVLAPYTPSGADNQPPKVTLTAPATGSWNSDTVVMQATATDNVAVAGVQFFVDREPVGPEDTTAPYSADADLMVRKFSRGTPTVTFWARARDTAGNVSVTNMKTMTINNKCTEVHRGQVQYGWMGAQTGTFTVRWSASMGADVFEPMDGGFSLTHGKPNYFSGTSTTVLFAPDMEIKVRNGASYPPTGVTYTALAEEQTYYRFRMVVDVPSNRYSVWYRPSLAEPEKQLAANAAFRTPATSLENWMLRIDDLSEASRLRACNVTVKPGAN